MWTRIDAPGGAREIEVSNMEGWQLTMPAGHVRWINGLRGGTSEAVNDATFAIQNRDPAEGDHIEIGSDRRSTEQFEPIVFVDNSQGRFYGGVIWSGAWRMSLDSNGGAFSMRAEFPGSSPLSSPSRPIEFPHSFFGVAAPDAEAEATALREFVLQGIRKGRPLQPLVTYNTWFGYGARINQSIVSEEMSRASGLGVELFVVDAGWYQGAGTNETFDFTTGLGSWTVDHDRFPDDLVGMADQAHAFGMKFGLWVEPERVALATVGSPGRAREEWLAMQNGSYGDATSAQLCLASDAARQWVFGRIVDLLDRVHPDYLKWDNNFWLNCNRPDHGHGVDEGNYSHVVALYGLLDELRRRYPDMLIENVSGGGSRLDFGMLAYSDAAWMDDGTAPSSHVRHNLEGLTLAFPPAYLLSFVIDNSNEPLRVGEDLAYVARSRMPGILGVATRYFDLEPEVGAALAEEIAQYKSLRDRLSQPYAVLLSAQAPVDIWGWDVLMEVSGDRRAAVIFAYKANADQGSVLIKPQNLVSDSVYHLESMGSGDMGEWTGAQLMQDGIEIVHYDGSRAHVIIFSPPLRNEPQP
jgi:alpha-galactosidase